MGKVFADNCDIFDNVTIEIEDTIKRFVENPYHIKTNSTKKLSSKIKYFSELNDCKYNIMSFNNDFSDKKIRQIVQELANAIDNNSTKDIKNLKLKYQNSVEFTKAKDILNRECKEIWNVFDKKTSNIKIPYEAMKTLGITNQPSLDFLLENSLNLFEKDNGTTTVDIISSILNNDNIKYTFDDIYNYLKKKYIKNNCQYNFITIKYLAKKVNYDSEKLVTLGISKEDLKNLFKSLTLKNKIKYLYINYLKTK